MPTYRDQKIRHLSLILRPRISILESAASNVSPRTVRDHDAEEGRIEPGEWAVKPGDQRPRKRKEHIAGIVQLARHAVPAISENPVAGPSRYRLGILEFLPWQLGEGGALDKSAPLDHAERVFLAVACVPDPVDKQVGCEEGSECRLAPGIRGRVMVGQVQRAMAVRHGDATHVPEDQHKAVFLVVHVPGGRDEMLALGAGIGVKKMGHDEKQDLAGDVAVLLVLAHRGGATESEQNKPGDADLLQHLQIDAQDARVQLGPHEEVINGVAGHAVLRASSKCREVDDEAGQEAGKNGHRQQRPKLIQQRVQREDARRMEHHHQRNRRIEADVR